MILLQGQTGNNISSFGQTGDEALPDKTTNAVHWRIYATSGLNELRGHHMLKDLSYRAMYREYTYEGVPPYT